MFRSPVNGISTFVREGVNRARAGALILPLVAGTFGVGLGEGANCVIKSMNADGLKQLHVNSVDELRLRSEDEKFFLHMRLACDAIFAFCFGVPTLLVSHAVRNDSKERSRDIICRGYNKLMGVLIKSIENQSPDVELKIGKKRVENVSYEDVFCALKLFLNSGLKKETQDIIHELGHVAMRAGCYPASLGGKQFLNFIQTLPNEVQGSSELKTKLRDLCDRANRMPFLAFHVIEHLSLTSFKHDCRKVLRMDNATEWYNINLPGNLRNYAVEFRNVSEGRCEFKTYKIDRDLRPHEYKPGMSADASREPLKEELFPALDRPDLGVQNLGDGWYKTPLHSAWREQLGLAMKGAEGLVGRFD